MRYRYHLRNDGPKTYTSKGLSLVTGRFYVTSDPVLVARLRLCPWVLISEDQTGQAGPDPNRPKPEYLAKPVYTQPPQPGTSTKGAAPAPPVVVVTAASTPVPVDESLPDMDLDDGPELDAALVLARSRPSAPAPIAAPPLARGKGKGKSKGHKSITRRKTT